MQYDIGVTDGAGNRTSFGDEATYTRRRGHVFVRLPNGQAVSFLYARAASTSANRTPTPRG